MRGFRRNSLVLVQKIKPKALVFVLAKVKYRRGLGRACHNSRSIVQGIGDRRVSIMSQRSEIRMKKSHVGK